MSTVPQELNWVEKRATCTAEMIFSHLVAEVYEDVKAHNAVQDSRPQFAAELTKDKRALVVGETGTWARKEQVRIFPLNGNIEVRNEVTNSSISAQVFLTEDGRCKLKMQDGRELERWQFRRLALEELLFGLS